MEMSVHKLAIPFGSFYSYANIKIDGLTSLELRLIPVRNARIKKIKYYNAMYCTLTYCTQ